MPAARVGAGRPAIGARRLGERWTAIGLALLAAALIALHLLALHQGPAWASPLLIGDHLFDLLLAVALLCYALAIGRKLIRPLAEGDDDPLTLNLIALGLGAGALSLAILCMGFLRLYYGPALLIAVLASVLWLRDELLVMWHGAGVALRDWFRAGMPTAPTRLQRAVLLILLLALATAVVRATNPVAGILVDWDAAAYHLAGAKIYVAAHRFLPLPGIPLTNAPSSEEMLFVAGLLAGDESLGKALAVCFAVALGLATFALGRRHFGAPTGWLGVLLLFSNFWLVILLPLTVTDFAETFFIVLGLSDLLAWLGREAAAPVRTETGAGRRWAMAGDRLLVRAGLLLGFAVAFKLTGLPVLPVALLTLGIVRLCIGGTGLADRLVRAVRAGVILGCAALVPLSPWLLKNLYFFHSALYPIAVTASDPRTVGESTVAASPGPMSTAEHIWWLVSTAAQYLWHFVGPLSICLLVAPLVIRRVEGRAAMLFLGIGSIVWLAFVPNYTPRYYLALAVVGAVLIAAVVLTLIDRLRLPRLLCEIGLAAYLLVAAIWTLGVGVGMMLKDGSFDQARGVLSEDTYIAHLARPYQAEVWINSHTSPGTPVVLVGVSRGLYLDRPYLEDWYGERLATLEAFPAARTAAARDWCSRGIRYAIFDRGDDSYDDPAKAGIRPFGAFAWVHQPGLRPRVLFSANGVDVVELHPCG